MKSLSSIALLMLALTGCAQLKPYYRVGLGTVTRSHNMVGSNPYLRADLGVSRPLFSRTHVWCEASHQSSLMSGLPFNDERETEFDMVLCGVGSNANGR